MDGDTPFSRSGLVARSPEGHAAKGMHIKGDETAWIDIQNNTFKNWVNEQLRAVGTHVNDLHTGFGDGLKLVALVEVLQKRKLPKIKKPINQHQFLENVQTALNAIAADGVKLVNIGNTDIVEGNLKLILGLIWSLILRYQIGRTKFPPKKLMLAWLKAVLPDCRVTNFTRDWSTGINLSALVDYCKPGLMPQWNELDPRDSINNCRNAMQVAKEEFGIPMVLQPEYLASPNLDELSGMTYLSYFMKEDSPGYWSTLNWVRRQLSESNVRNFTTDWNDGTNLCSLVRSLGASVPGYSKLSKDVSHWESNLQTGIEAGRRFGVEPVLKAKSMADPEVEHLGPMAYVANFQWIRPRKRPWELISINSEHKSVRVHSTATFRVDFHSKEIESTELTAEVRGPSGRVDCKLNLNRHHGQGTFVPSQIGMHQVSVFCEGEPVDGSPLSIRVLPDLSKIQFAGIDPCAKGSLVEVLINSRGAGVGGLLQVEAVSPSGRTQMCPVTEEDAIFSTTFQPDEAGEWKIAILYEGEHINGSPFTCYCYDPHAVKVRNLNGAATGHPMTFTVDTSEAGWGEVKVDITHGGKSLPHRIEDMGGGVYQVTFTPTADGKHRVYVYFNGIEVKGSPFKLRITPTLDVNTVTATGDGLKMVHVGRLAKFNINCRGAGTGDVDVQIVGPSRKSTVPIRLIAHRDGTMTVEYTAVEVGEHTVDIRIKGHLVRGSPFRVQAFDPRQVKVGRITDGHVGKAVEFEVETSRAGHGNVELIVNEGHVTSTVTNLSSHRYMASFIAHKAMTHSVQVLFNGEQVPGSPFKCTVTENSPANVTVSGSALEGFSCAQTASVEIHANGFSKEDIQVTVLNPSKKSISYNLIEVHKGVYLLEFVGQKVGAYSIEITVAGQKIPGSPFVTKGYDARLIRISDIANAVVGQQQQFQVDASSAGEGQLEISVNEGEVPNQVEVVGGGRCLVSFTPDTPKTHIIDIKFNDETVPGCPLKCKVSEFLRATVDAQTLELVSINRPARFDVDVEGGTEAELRVTATAPNGSTLPVQITGSARNGFMAEFIPKQVGPHKIFGEYGNTEVAGTPFTCKVFDSQRVVVGDIPQGMLGKTTQFVVDASQAGEGNLEITIRAQGVNIPTEVSPLGTARFAVGFTPVEAVDHVIDIAFNKESVAGSPFRAKIQDVGKVAGKIQVLGQKEMVLSLGEDCSFNLSNVSGNAQDLEVHVEAPDGYPTQPRILEGNDHTFWVEFTPRITGEYKVHISFCKVPIPGSPFICRVYDVKQIKVREIPRGYVGKPVTFQVETNNAGPGNLEVTVNNGQVASSAQAQGNHVYAITFLPREAKQHTIDVKFNGEHVPGSPFRCVVSDPSRLQVMGEGLDKVAVGRTASFTLHPNGSLPEQVDVTITAPSRRTVPATVTQSNDGSYAIKYLPTEVGDHVVEVKYGEISVPGSPFLVKAYDASKVYVTDITQGITGKPVYFSIDASLAGAGNLEIVVSVNAKNVPNYVQSEGNAKFRVNFRPQDAQPHTIRVKFNGESVPGSPFTVRVTDNISGVHVTGTALRIASVSRTASFTVDATSISASDCTVTVVAPSGRTLPVRVVNTANGRFQVEFSPNEVGPHLIHVAVEDNAVPGSPFTCNVFDIKKIQVMGLEPGTVEKPVTFSVDASQAGEGTLELVVTTRKTSVRAEVMARSRGLYDVTFVPHEAIPHFVNVSFNEEEIPGSPFHCETLESQRDKNIALHRMDNRLLSSSLERQRKYQTESLVETSRYEKSSTHHDIITNGPSSPRLVQAVNGNDEVDSGHKWERHKNFNSNEISESLYEHHVTKHITERIESTHEWKQIHHSGLTDAQTVYAKGDGLSSQQATVGSVASFDINAKGIDSDLEIKVADPNNKPVPTKVIRLKSGIYRAEYHMTVIGTYTIEAFHKGMTVFRQPFLVEVCNPDRVTMTNPSNCVVGKEASFTVNTSSAGKGTLTVLLRAAGHEVKHRVDTLAGGIHEVVFTPRAPTLHRIDIRYNGQQVPGSPREIEVKDPATGRAIIATGVGLHQGKSHKTCSFVIETLGYEAKDFDVIVTGPKDTLVPVQCYQQKDGNLVAKFIPMQAGSHHIEVHYNGKPIKNSPFVCQVYDSSQVIIEEITTTTYTVNEKISFRLNRRNAGYAELDVTVTSPLGKNLPIEVKGTPDGEGELIQFFPTIPGKYKISILYGGEEVNGSPITFTIEDDGIARVYGDGLLIGQQDQPTVFRIDARGLHGEPHVQVDGPDSVARCSIEEEEDGIFIVTYVPQEVGVFDVSIMWNGKEVAGSPFHPRIVNTRKVTVINGWENIVDSPNRMSILPNVEKKFTFEVSEAGPGMLTAEVKGPRGSQHCTVEAISNTKDVVSFTPVEKGDYFVHVYFAGLPLPRSPYLCVAEDDKPQLDHTRVVLRGPGATSGHVGHETHVIVDGSDAGPGSPEVSLTGVKADIHVNVVALGNNVYKATYTPSLGGAYLLNVMWSGRQVRGCPIKINVTSNSDPSKVTCTGDGLRGGALGKEIKAFIDTRKAGSGELSTHCIGPHKVAYCELYDHEDGTFTLFLKPQEAGRHTLSIKFNGDHITGSPYTVKIAGAPDASKVRVYGPGIEPGVLANYQSRFICETRGAGSGQLTVRIRGPKGAFRVEMQRENQKDRTILCKYDPTEPGDYRIEVKWSGEDVPGSPFHVMILDTQEELNRYQQHVLLRAADPQVITGGGGGGTRSPNNYTTAIGHMSFGQTSWRGSQAQL